MRMPWVTHNHQSIFRKVKNVFLDGGSHNKNFEKRFAPEKVTRLLFLIFNWPPCLERNLPRSVWKYQPLKFLQLHPPRVYHWTTSTKYKKNNSVGIAMRPSKGAFVLCHGSLCTDAPMLTIDITPQNLWYICLVCKINKNMLVKNSRPDRWNELHLY